MENTELINRKYALDTASGLQFNLASERRTVVSAPAANFMMNERDKIAEAFFAGCLLTGISLFLVWWSHAVATRPEKPHKPYIYEGPKPEPARQGQVPGLADAPWLYVPNN